MPGVRHAAYLESQDALTERFAASSPPTVWAYLRAGSDPEEILSTIEEYAKQEELESPVLVRDVDDENLRPRPLLLRLASCLAGVKNPHLVVRQIEHLSSSIAEQEALVWIFRRAGVMLHVVNEFPEHDPIRDAVKVTLETLRLYQTALVSVKENTGLLLKSLHGRWTGGTPPFGYKAENGELALDEYTSKMVRYVFFLRLHYPMSARQIGAHIEANKIASDSYNYSTRKILKILAHEKLYRGEYRDCYGATHPRPDLKILPDTTQELKDLHVKDPAHEHQVDA